jgi:hypothetical protein
MMADNFFEGAVNSDITDKLEKYEELCEALVGIDATERLQDASQEAISHFDLRKEGGIHDYGADKGKYQQFWHSDYVCHTDPKAFDPSKVEEDDE